MSNFLLVAENESGSDNTLIHITTPADGLLTLCGLSDALGMDAEEVNEKPTCSECLAVLRHCANVIAGTRRRSQQGNKYAVPGAQKAIEMAREITYSSKSGVTRSGGAAKHGTR